MERSTRETIKEGDSYIRISSNEIYKLDRFSNVCSDHQIPEKSFERIKNTVNNSGLFKKVEKHG
jgi:hypothetical protein